MDVIAVLGFGEAGSLLASDLVAAGATVRGFDPKLPAPPGVTGAGSDAEKASENAAPGKAETRNGARSA